MEEIFRVLLENIPDPLWIKDLDLKYIFVTQGYADIYGKKVDEFINLKPRKEEECINGVFRECTIFPIIDSNNKLVALGGIVVNINEVK